VLADADDCDNLLADFDTPEGVACAVSNKAEGPAREDLRCE